MSLEKEKYYYSITEVAEMFKINASTLRFWEKEFPTLKPDTNLKGNRKYTKKDIELIKQIHYYSVTKATTPYMQWPIQMPNRLQLQFPFPSIHSVFHLSNIL